MNSYSSVPVPGYSLPRDVFLDVDRYEKDLRLIANTFWLFVGHVSQIPNAGDFFTYQFSNDSVIVVRTPGSQVRAFHNVCRHRGARLCSQLKGTARSFTCPYHAWTYELSGQLRRAPSMHDEFDPIGFHLIPCPIGVVGGLIFVSFSEAPPDLQSYLAGFAKELEFHDTKSASVALQSVVTANANWKLLVQNNLECYHCQPAHPTYWRAHPGLGERLPRRNPQIRDNELLTELASAQRTPRRFETCSATAASQFFQTIDSDVIGGHATTESVNGAPVARAMGHATFDGSLSFFASPVLTVTLNPDYSIIYSFVPRGIRRTDIEITWLVDPKSTQDPGFDLGKLTEVWATTLTEDKMLVESNQLGVESSAYRPGPYSTLERRLTAFDCWYLSRVPR